jgi:two-component system phosphate regulon sensor histidine kinase PhoR
MRKVVIRNNILLLLSAFMLFFVIVFLALYQFEKRHQTSMMSFLLDEVTTSYDNFNDSDQAFVSSYDQSQRRITILDENGYVIADTHDDEIGEDKSQRPEILNLEEVYSRKSDTIGVDLLYMARQLDDGTYIRVSIPLETQITTYRQVLWALVMSGLGILGIYYFVLKKVNQNLLKPWDKVKEGVVRLNQGKYQMMTLNSPYEEINEMLHEMNQINYDTSKYLNRINSYQEQLRYILNEIRQSILLFDNHKKLMFFNQDAKNLFDLKDEYINQEGYKFIRDIDLNKALDHVFENNEAFKKDYRSLDRIYDCYIYPLHKNEEDEGLASILMVLKDVTEERQIGQMKRDFFSHASHELKSPLTAIRGYAELILYDMIKEKDIKESSQKIITQTEFMSALVEDMLMLSRLENIKEESYQDIYLNQILDEVLDTLSQPLKEKDMKIELVKKEDIKHYGDPLDFSKLFKNLIENAYKYSDSGKTISIELKTQKDQVVFIVKDQGKGIPKEHQSRVFERFYRVDKGRLDGGTGLGLAIVKHIAIKYDGKVDLKSSLSEGTTIKVYLKHVMR